MLFIQSRHGSLLLSPYNERGAVQLLPEIGEPPLRFPPAEPAAAVSDATGVAPLARPISTSAQPARRSEQSCGGGSQFRQRTLAGLHFERRSSSHRRGKIHA